MAAVTEPTMPSATNGSHPSGKVRKSAGLPTAPKRPRNTIWMVGGLALMLVSLLGALGAAQSLSDRTEVLVSRRSFSLGETVSRSDLAVADVAVDGSVTLLTPDRIDDIVGLVAAGPIAEGEILVESDFTTSGDVDVITVIAGLELSPGAYPRVGLQPGDLVTILEVSDIGFVDDVVADPRRVGDGEVVETRRLTNGDLLLVSLRIPEHLSEQVSQAAFEERIRLVQKEFADDDGRVVPLDPLEPAEAVDTGGGAGTDDGAGDQ